MLLKYIFSWSNKYELGLGLRLKYGITMKLVKIESYLINWNKQSKTASELFKVRLELPG